MAYKNIEADVFPSIIIQKIYEKSNSLQVTFRKTLHSSMEYVTEFLFLYQNNIEKELNDLISKKTLLFDKTIKELLEMQMAPVSEKLDFINNFYENNIEMLEKIKSIMQEQYYPPIKNTNLDFSHLESKISQKSLFQDFNIKEQGKEIDINTAKMIKPPDNYGYYLNEEECTKYDKFVSVVNIITSLRDLINAYPQFKESRESLKQKEEEEDNKFKQQFVVKCLKELAEIKMKHNVQIESLRESYEAQIESLNEKHEEQIEKLKNDYEKQIADLRNETSSIEKPKIKIEDSIKEDPRDNILQQRINKLTSDNSNLRSSLQQYENIGTLDEFIKLKEENKNKIIDSHQKTENNDESSLSPYETREDNKEGQSESKSLFGTYCNIE